jgi:hypothetical protein
VRPDRALTILSAEGVNSDPDLAAMLAIWPVLAKDSRKLLLQTAETLATSSLTGGKGKNRGS